MVTAIDTAINNIKSCVDKKKNFVLQGGAGSGKTETLKQALEYISIHFPTYKVACITHTNLAAEEIESRVGTDYTVATIHSFLSDLIKNYKKNIHEVMHELFVIQPIERDELSCYLDEKEQKEVENKKYKKTYDKFLKSSFLVENLRIEKVTGKRVYDKSPLDFNADLNSKIIAHNEIIKNSIRERDYLDIEYNMTAFNNYKKLSYGHDGLIDLANLLFVKYPVIGRILQSKFDCIFVDEYQDTSSKIVDIFLNHMPVQDDIVIGFFGDSMQAIYSDGIGSLEEQVKAGQVKKIEKDDNYRCSEQVVKFINALRTDTLKQDVAFKSDEKGVLETISDRQGAVDLYYAVKPPQPSKKQTPEEKIEAKEIHIRNLERIIGHASTDADGNVFRQLKLTNKSIAFDAGFEALYSIFSDRYSDPKELIDKHLGKMQFKSLFDLCNAYSPLPGVEPDYNLVYQKLKEQGFYLNSLSDKKLIQESMDKIIHSKAGATDVLKLAFEFKLVTPSSSYLAYIESYERFMEEIKDNEQHIRFGKLYVEGKNTFTRIKHDIEDINQDDFNELERDYKQERFYSRFFSNELKFSEMINYFHYLNEDTNYITMHKTKGSGIDNVIVVLDEYSWSQAYNFKSFYSPVDSATKQSNTQKLVYVACSRAKKNLRCVRIVEDAQEEKELLSFFAGCNVEKYDYSMKEIF
jgi:DNA helicase-2/ATP-dependent DNA helicase PcrA